MTDTSMQSPITIVLIRCVFGKVSHCLVGAASKANSTHLDELTQGYFYYCLVIFRRNDEKSCRVSLFSSFDYAGPEKHSDVKGCNYDVSGKYMFCLCARDNCNRDILQFQSHLERAATSHVKEQASLAECLLSTVLPFFSQTTKNPTTSSNLAKSTSSPSSRFDKAIDTTANPSPPTYSIVPSTATEEPNADERTTPTSEANPRIADTTSASTPETGFAETDEANAEGQTATPSGTGRADSTVPSEPEDLTNSQRDAQSTEDNEEGDDWTASPGKTPRVTPATTSSAHNSSSPPPALEQGFSFPWFGYVGIVCGVIAAFSIGVAVKCCRPKKKEGDLEAAKAIQPKKDLEVKKIPTNKAAAAIEGPAEAAVVEMTEPKAKKNERHMAKDASITSTQKVEETVYGPYEYRRTEEEVDRAIFETRQRFLELQRPAYEEKLEHSVEPVTVMCTAEEMSTIIETTEQNTGTGEEDRSGEMSATATNPDRSDPRVVPDKKVLKHAPSAADRSEKRKLKQAKRDRKEAKKAKQSASEQGGTRTSRSTKSRRSGKSQSRRNVNGKAAN